MRLVERLLEGTVTVGSSAILVRAVVGLHLLCGGFCLWGLVAGTRAHRLLGPAEDVTTRKKVSV